MKKIIYALILAFAALSQTACVIRYKLPEESSDSSEYSSPITNFEGIRTAGDYTIKYAGNGVEIVCYTGSASGVTIPKELEGFDVVSIGESAFADRRDITSITVPDSVLKIGDNAFAGCRGLLKITLPDTVTDIGKGAFDDCTRLKSIHLPEKLRSIETYTFHNCYDLEEIVVPDSVKYIETRAFFNCTSLESAVLSKNLTSLGADAFYNCYTLKSIALPDSLTFIGKKTFEGCFRLEEISFKGNIYKAYIGDDDYDHSELLLAVNGELPDDENSGEDY